MELEGSSVSCCPKAHNQGVRISTKESVVKSWQHLQEQTTDGFGGVVKAVKKHKGATLNISMLLLLCVVIIFGASDIGHNATPLSFSASARLYGPASADEIAGAEVAAAIAQATNLVIADNVTNLADSLSVQVRFAGTDTEPYINNPNSIATSVNTRTDITYYTTQSGDTVSTVARQFGISSDTIRWANTLSGNSLLTGTKLKILPVTGIQHRVVAGDTPVELARYYGSSASLIVSFNDAELKGLKVGTNIIIPDGRKPVTFAVNPHVATVFGPISLSYGGNGYSYGYCTYGVAIKRAEIGRPLPRGLGNANTWFWRAPGLGLKTGIVPRAGAVIWHVNPPRDPRGHVGFVQKVNANGSITVIDMNYERWGAFSSREIPVSDFVKYRFIY